MSGKTTCTFFPHFLPPTFVGRGGVWVVFLMVYFISTLLGWGQITTIPTYTWQSDFSLPTVNVSLTTLSVNSEDITISVATDPLGNVYTLTFGKGVAKRSATGALIDANFIPSSRLDSPLDMAIDADGFIYIADYFAGGETFEDNGKIWVFDSNGTFLASRTILTSFYRPLGVDVDENKVYVAEFNDGNSGPEPNKLSRISIYDKNTRDRLLFTENANTPFRIAVDSQKKIYVSQAGNSSPSVRIYDQNLIFQNTLPNILSPGSIVIDPFDFIHVIEYDGRIDFSRFINFENLSFPQVQSIAKSIDDGQRADAFSIKVFDPGRVLRITYKDRIDFPVDLTFNSCDRMYVNNAEIFGSNSIFGYIPNRLEFDLEIYKRTPSFDIEDPVIACGEDMLVTAPAGQNTAIVTFTNPTATDNCSVTVAQTAGQASGSQFAVGTHTIEFTATDAAGNTASCSFTIKVDPTPDTNTPPVAVEDVGLYSMLEDNVLEVLVSQGVLQNDSDPEGDELIAVLDRTTNYGVLDLREDGSFTYTPNPDFNGTDTFTYFANDGQVNSAQPVVVEIVVKPVPDIICETSFTLELDANGEAFLRKEDLYEVDQSDVQFSLSQENFTCADPRINSVTLSYTYTIPDEGSFTDSCDIQIIVVDNTAPTITCPGNINESMAFGETGKIITYNLPVFDDNCSATIIQTAGLASESVFPEGSTINTFEVKDGSGKIATCSFTVTIDKEAEVEDAIFQNCPADAIIENTSPGECGTNVTFSIPTASDANGILSVNQMEGPESGEYFQLGDTDVVFEATGSNGNTVECRFTVSIIDNENPVINCPDSIVVDVDPGETTKAVTFQKPTESDNCGVSNVEQTEGLSSGSQFPIGITTITFTATDGAGNSFPCSFTVTVNPETPPENQAPVARDDFYTVEQELSLTVIAAEGVLVNDGDETSGVLTAEIVDDVINGTLNLNPDGSFTYTPNPGIVGFDEFTYVANDGELDSNVATVRIEITSTAFPNFRPNAVNDSYPTPYETTLTIQQPGFLGNDTDGDNDVLTAEIITNVTNGTLAWNPDGSFNYVPNAGFFGNDSFTYVANDGKEDSNIATVTIIVDDPEGQNPLVAQDDNFSIFIDQTLDVPAPGILVNDSFNALTSIRLLIDVGNGSLTLNNDGSFIFIPNARFTGEDSFRYIILDGGLESNSATVTITVEPRPTQNVAPVARDDFYEIQQDGILVVDAPGMLGNDTDANGDALTASVGSVSATGSFEFNGDGSFKYTPLPGFVGTESFTYVANDGSLNSNIATVTITVNGSSTSDFLCKDEFILQLDETGNAILQASNLYTGDPGDREFTLSTSSFDCTNIGENSVVLNYTGNEGSGSCTIKVIIEDNLPPEIQAQNISISLDSFGFASITPELIDNGTTDNCEVDELSLDILDFSCENLGLNPVLFIAKDGSGNTSSQMVNVTVTGNCKQKPITGIEYISIYPNPTTGPFTFDVPTGWVIEKVDVFDSRGRYITSAEFVMGEPYTMDLSTLQTAVYTLHLATNQGNKIIRVIIQ
ncbi:Ig-like domain-containing protein [Gillisia limnaea]|uniref:Hyalin n=1 Tax=Gillisia limnaea (strain DSM 15749 / LMG 21470 / R-8282) TaxID=865937 RepID=H2BT88_GILLR|nr:Ig-like domain-containing protein [Gillisia limnaea]EHQ03687.1 Hyalin [Gillisia limnaea DSM 15749]